MSANWNNVKFICDWAEYENETYFAITGGCPNEIELHYCATEALHSAVPEKVIPYEKKTKLIFLPL